MAGDPRRVIGVRHASPLSRGQNRRKGYYPRCLARLFRRIYENYLATEIPTPEEIQCAPRVLAEQGCFGR